jgi:hypothetical protein
LAILESRYRAGPHGRWRWGASGPGQRAPARWRSDETTTGRTAMWTAQDPTQPLFILRLSPFNTQANHSTLAAASPTLCCAVGRGGGGHEKSPGRTVGTPAQYSSGLQEPSRSWISNTDIPDRRQRQQGSLCSLAQQSVTKISMKLKG